MPNIILTHTIKKETTETTNRSEILKSAWSHIKNGMSKKLAFKKAWSEHNKISISFWTNAKEEDIRWTIKSCQKDGKVNKELLRKWDRDRIQHQLDWVSYHLRRNGFYIEPIKNVYSLTFENIPLLNI